MTELYAEHSATVDPKQRNTANLTMDWFSSKGFYPPREGVEVTPLINGQAAFTAVDEAISKARKSVDIITWGFDPAMRFRRPDGQRIGDLLASMGRSGVKVRVLVWKNAVANLAENTVIGDGVVGSGGTSAGSGVTRGRPASNEKTRLEMQREHNTKTIERLQAALSRSQQLQREGRLDNYDPEAEKHVTARIIELENENAAIDARINELEGYGGYSGSGGTQLNPEDQAYTRDWFKNIHSGKMTNVEFRTRDFKQTASLVVDRDQVRLIGGRLQSLIELLKADGIGDLSVAQMLLLTQFASHHQKMVLVDDGHAESALGFVMGHNMHRNYWDTDAHLFDDRAAGRDPGFGPWQDVSMKVRGPVLRDLSHNFTAAWDLESVWYTRWFDGTLRQERKALPAPPVVNHGAYNMAQICRTQPQDGETSILDIYRKALGNVRDYVYMENQYFRYAEFAERLSTLAAARSAKMAPNDLYLFVVTNTPDSKTASKTTYAMLKGLGQEQLMPQVQRDLAGEAQRLRRELDQLEARPKHNDPYVRNANEQRISRLRQRLEALRQQGVTPEVEERLGTLKKKDIPELAQNTSDDEKPYELSEIPGLKVVIATLATSNPVPGTPAPKRLSPEAEAALDAPPEAAKYRNIYVHSKLLLVDSLFTLLSSANINIRSMHSDSELGIAMPNPKMAKDMQEKLWGMHSGRFLESTEDNFKYWEYMLDDNWRRMKNGEPLACHLVRFWDVTTPYSPMLTVD
jgi:phosphatidylserine/phosphatidylglycerophosphate/cardiolipin synthase-like enzyme